MTPSIAFLRSVTRGWKRHRPLSSHTCITARVVVVVVVAAVVAAVAAVVLAVVVCGETTSWACEGSPTPPPPWASTMVARSLSATRANQKLAGGLFIARHIGSCEHRHIDKR
jgi:hypothetical protein